MAETTKINHVALLNEAVEMDGSLGAHYSYFRNLSLGNMALLYAQGAREIVGKFHDWPKVGRHVLKNNRAFEIIRPIFYMRKTEDDEEVEALRGFKPVKCMFTLSQTEGEPVAPPQTPQWDVEQMLANVGIQREPFDSMSGNLQGYSHGLFIAVSPIAKDPLKTTLHEAAHVLFGHTLGHQLEAYRTHRGIMEYQAEAAAYLVLKTLGVMDEETARNSRGYCQHWLRNEKPPEQAALQVLTVADRILKAGQLAVSGSLPETPAE